MKHPDSAIKSNSAKKIWESLHFILGKTCKKESCWLRHKCLKQNVDLSVLKEDFSPKAPEEWKKESSGMVNKYRNIRIYEAI